MIDSLYIAWKYIQYHRGKSLILLACITLIVSLPWALSLLLDESEQQLMSRATSTPLVIGAKGSSLDLLMNTLYFGDEVPESIVMAVSDTVTDTDLAYPIPMYIRFKT
jgi:putative ABC transport system permease protein